MDSKICYVSDKFGSAFMTFNSPPARPTLGSSREGSWASLGKEKTRDKFSGSDSFTRPTRGYKPKYVCFQPSPSLPSTHAGGLKESRDCK